MGLAWKCDIREGFYIGHECDGICNSTDTVYIRTENSRGELLNGIGYTICPECRKAVEDLIKNRKPKD